MLHKDTYSHHTGTRHTNADAHTHTHTRCTDKGGIHFPSARLLHSVLCGCIKRAAPAFTSLHFLSAKKASKKVKFQIQLFQIRNVLPVFENSELAERNDSNPVTNTSTTRDNRSLNKRMKRNTYNDKHIFMKGIFLYYKYLTSAVQDTLDCTRPKIFFSAIK